MMSVDMDAERTRECLSRLDGLLLAGGNDVAPALYGQSPIPRMGEVNPLRDSFETMLIKEAYQRDLPTLGICRGIQAMNVVLGGTLYQDLPSQHPSSTVHAQTQPDNVATHDVHIGRDTLLYNIIAQERISVNSFHHQAVCDSAPCVNACAQADDGVIEGIEAPDKAFMLGIQWHPERMYSACNAAGALFKALIQAAFNTKY